MQLGFHLAACNECRWYRDYYHSPPELPLLQEIASSGAFPAPDGLFSARPARTTPRDLGVWRVLLGALLSCGLLVLALFTSAALRAYQNIDTMISPAPAASAGQSARFDAARRPGRAVGTKPTPSIVADPTVAPAAAAIQPLWAPPIPDAGGPITILVLGVDRRPDETRPPRTDALLVVHLDPDNGRAAVLSLPRDLWVAIPGQAPNRINSAYAAGEAHTPGSGVALARATVSNLLDIPIDGYVMVDFQGFVGLVDAIGGITVNVERELYDSRYPSATNGYQEVYFAPGPTKMDGATALIYSRIRHPDSDFQRIRRQQEVIAGVVARLRERGVMRNLVEAEELTAALRDYVRTDISHERALGLLWALRKLEPGQVRRLAVGPEMVTMGVGKDLYAEQPDLWAIRQLASHLYR